MAKQAFGIPFKKNSKYEIYKNHAVRVVYSASSCIGVVDEIHDSHLNLKPSLIQEGLVNPDGTNKSIVRIERNIPLRANFGELYIEPLNEGYLEELAHSINSADYSNQTKI